MVNLPKSLFSKRDVLWLIIKLEMRVKKIPVTTVKEGDEL